MVTSRCLAEKKGPPLYAKRTASRSFLGAPYLHIEGLHKAEGRLRRGTEGASSLQRPSRSFVEGSENPSLRTTYRKIVISSRSQIVAALE